jgi:hypothetical protein
MYYLTIGKVLPYCPFVNCTRVGFCGAISSPNIRNSGMLDGPLHRSVLIECSASVRSTSTLVSREEIAPQKDRS